MTDFNLLIILALCCIVGYLCMMLDRLHKELNKVRTGIKGELDLIKKAHDANFLNFRDELERQLDGHNALVESTQDLADRHSKLCGQTRELGEHMLKINDNVNLVSREVGLDGC
jgi:hypothetical protein